MKQRRKRIVVRAEPPTPEQAQEMIRQSAGLIAALYDAHMARLRATRMAAEART